MGKTAKSSQNIPRGETAARRIGGIEIHPAKPVTKLPAGTAARIREAVRTVYGQTKKA